MLSMQLDQAYNVIALDYSCENGGCTSRESRDPEGVKLRVRVVITPGLYDCVFGDWEWRENRCFHYCYAAVPLFLYIQVILLCVIFLKSCYSAVRLPWSINQSTFNIMSKWNVLYAHLMFLCYSLWRWESIAHLIPEEFLVLVNFEAMTMLAKKTVVGWLGWCHHGRGLGLSIHKVWQLRKQGLGA